VTRRLPKALLLIALPALLIAGCGAEGERDVVEGEPVELGELTYNVQLSRFLNRNDSEDRYYLSGKPELPPSEEYFGVFIQIENDGGEAEPIPHGFEIEDTQGNRYSPERSRSVFALDLGGRIAAHSSAPAPDTPAASGPTEGALILYVVDRDVTENRPLHLLIPAPRGEPAEVELDI
jgi:hypothetical protein